MTDWPPPSTIMELRGFLGLTGYYQKFVQSYGTIARPLTNLLKKGRFDWTTNAMSTFASLKSAMTTTQILLSLISQFLSWFKHMHLEKALEPYSCSEEDQLQS